MDIVKKNWLSITFGVIAILAIVADFYPMAGKRTALKAQATAHAAQAATLKDLLTKPRNLPIVQPGKTEAEPLSSFPTALMVEEARKAVGQVNDAASQLNDKASKSNEHVPLVAGALPGTTDTLPASSFAREYVRLFPVPIAPGAVAAAPTTAPAPIPGRPTLMEILRGGVPPSDVELTAARAAKQDEIVKANTRQGPNGEVTNQDEVQQLVVAGLQTLGNDMRADRAKSCLVYVDPNAFSMYPNMTVMAVPDPTNIFWAQIGLWTQQDVCKAIYGINQSSPNVMEAPVKELLKISFLNDNQPNTQSQPGLVPVFVVPNLQPSAGVGSDQGAAMAPGAPTDPNAPPPPPPADPNAPLTKNILVSPTGRQSNGMFDVVHFDLDLIVDAGSVPQVLEGLGTGQYLDVMQVENLDTVDSSTLRGAGYYFGSKPCVHIRLKCEELYFRSWLGQYVPPRLKQVLGYPAPTPAPGA